MVQLLSSLSTRVLRPEQYSSKGNGYWTWKVFGEKELELKVSYVNPLCVDIKENRMGVPDWLSW